MAEPKQRMTRRRKNNRRSHHSLKKIQLVECLKCKKMIRPHTICRHCSNY